MCVCVCVYNMYWVDRKLPQHLTEKPKGSLYIYVFILAYENIKESQHKEDFT